MTSRVGKEGATVYALGCSRRTFSSTVDADGACADKLHPPMGHSSTGGVVAIVLILGLSAPGCRNGSARIDPRTEVSSSAAVVPTRGGPGAPPKLSIAERLKAIQKTVQSAALTLAPAEPGVDRVSPAGREALKELNSALQTFILGVLTSSAPSSAENDLVEQKLRDASIQVIGDDPEPLAEGRIGVKLREEPGTWIVTTVIRISNGASARLLVFDRATSKLLMDYGPRDLREVTDAYHDLTWTTQLGGSSRPSRRVLVAHTYPGIMTNWRTYTYRLLEVTNDPSQPRILAEGEVPGSLADGVRLKIHDDLGFGVSAKAQDAESNLVDVRHEWGDRGGEYHRVRSHEPIVDHDFAEAVS
jgi:hypothetical protein